DPVTWLQNTIPEAEEWEHCEPWDESSGPRPQINHGLIDAARQEWRDAPKGQGNDAFFRLGINLRKAGLSPSEVRRILTEEARHAHSPKDRKAQISGIMATLFKKRRCASGAQAERSTCEASA